MLHLEAIRGGGRVDGAENRRSRTVGEMRQDPLSVSGLPRISALRVGFPTDARDAPLQPAATTDSLPAPTALVTFTILSYLAAGPHPRRELTLIPRLGSPVLGSG